MPLSDNSSQDRPLTTPNPKPMMGGTSYRISDSNERSGTFNPFTGEDYGAASVSSKANAYNTSSRKMSTDFQKNLVAANNDL